MMSEVQKNEINEKQKKLLRKTLLGTSTFLIGASLFAFLNPAIVAEILETDQETAFLISLGIGFIGIMDFAVAFIIFKSKERV